jgi:hypothetical protein
MNPQTTIRNFNLYIDDTSELSSDEELSLTQRVFNAIWNDRPWEFAKTSYAGTTDGNEYITLPTDFAHILVNTNYSDNTYDAGKPVIFVGPNYDKYEVVNWSDRRQYRNRSNVCYIDIVNRRLYFTITPSAGLSVEFDYKKTAPTLELTIAYSVPTSFLSALDRAVFHGMCVDSFIIQQSDKAKSYLKENQEKYIQATRDLAYQNAQLIQM